MGDSLFCVIIIFGLIFVGAMYYWAVLAFASIVFMLVIVMLLYLGFKHKEFKGLLYLIILIPLTIYTFPFFVQLVKLIFTIIFLNS